MSAVIQRHLVVKRETIGAQAAQPAISDSRSVLRQRRCQPVSRKVHGGQKRWETKTSVPTHYLLLNSSNLGRDNEGTGMCRFLPSSPLQILLAKPFSGTSLFCHEASANQTIQVKITLLSLIVFAVSPLINLEMQHDRRSARIG